MIYGGYAKSITNTINNTKVVSESDAILEYLMNESNNYDVILTESYITEEERLIMEAKLEAIQEAVSGVIIAAICAILAAIVALITKFIGMMKNVSDKVKQKFKNKNSDGGFKELTPKEKSELESKIEDLVNSLNYEDEIKAKLKNFCPIPLEFNMADLEENVKEIIADLNKLKVIDKSTQLDKAKSIIEPFYDKMIKMNNELKFKELEESIKSGDLLKEICSATISGGPAAAVIEIKRFLDSNYFDKVSKSRKDVLNEIEKLKKVMDSLNNKKMAMALHPDNHNGDKSFNDVISKLSGGLSVVKDMISSYREFINFCAKVEKFRLQYCNIVAQYI